MEKRATTPFFSIVIPTLNEEKYLPDLLLDLCNQTFNDFEVIVVDGRSEDQTIPVSQQFGKKFERLQILESDQRNVSHQRNLGAQAALADWLIFFDADNRLPEGFVQEIRNLVKRQKSDVLSTWFQPDSEDISYKILAFLSNAMIAIRKNTASPLIREAFVCVKKDIFINLGGFDETVRLREGSVLLKRAYQAKKKFALYREPKFICSYRRVRKQGIVRTFIKSLQVEYARLARQRISEESSRILYPMEGGRYFEKSESSPKADNHDSLKNILRRIFRPLEP